jgi:hypothetical protein
MNENDPAHKITDRPDIRRATRKHHSAEDKIRIVLEGLRDKSSQLHRMGRRSALPDAPARRHRRHGQSLQLQETCRSRYDQGKRCRAAVPAAL